MMRQFAWLLAGVPGAVLAAPVVERDAASPVSTVSRDQIENLPTGRSVEDLLKICPANTIPSDTSRRPATSILDGGVSASGAGNGLRCLQPDDLRMIEIYRGHNIARAEFGSRPLLWDPMLAQGAATYAFQLTQEGRLIHSSREGRGDIRENLLQNLPGGRSPSQMVDVWVAERRYFIPGVFPNVSSTGNWWDIGHFTQVVWPTTTHIGCAINGDSRFEWLVCRYSPGGNKDGRSLGSPSMPSPRHVVASNPPMPQPRAEVARQPIANQGDIAPSTSTTPANRPVIPKLPVGGGMTQLDPPAPPRPTARDDAPEGEEARHPLVTYFNEAFARHGTATGCRDSLGARIELDRMRYALDELRKRLKAARQAGPFSAVKPEDVQRQIDEMERKIREAEQRRPGDACPPMPQPRGVVSQ